MKTGLPLQPSLGIAPRPWDIVDQQGDREHFDTLFFADDHARNIIDDFLTQIEIQKNSSGIFLSMDFDQHGQTQLFKLGFHYLQSRNFVSQRAGFGHQPAGKIDNIRFQLFRGRDDLLFFISQVCHGRGPL